ncbi:MAG: hypothetical protein ACRDY4_10120 [Acidimicrobiia bacterium]
MRHGVRLAVGLSVCIGIAGASLFLLVDDLVPEPKTADDLGEPLDSEVEGLPVPAEADLLDGESGTLEPGEGLVSGRVYDFPGGFSRGDVERWYEDQELADKPWRDQWTWCPPAEPAGNDVDYVWVLPALDAILSLEVGTDDRDGSPAAGEVVVRMEIRQLSSVPPEEQRAC